MGKRAIFLSIRDKAKRLPGKVRAPIAGKPAVVHLIERLKRAPGADMVVLTTSVHPDDAGLVTIAEQNGILAFRGNEDDKLDRYLKAADQFGVEFMVVVDGDDLLADPDAIGEIIKAYNATKSDYIIVDHLPVGATGFGVKIEALRKVCAEKAENDTEVWGAYFTRPGMFKTMFLDPAPELKHPEYRMTLDYQEDLDFFRAVFEALYPANPKFTLKDVCQLLAKRPEIAKINAAAQQRYEGHLKKSAAVKFKSDVAGKENQA